jgi:hypothetical protein
MSPTTQRKNLHQLVRIPLTLILIVQIKTLREEILMMRTTMIA